MSLRKGAFDKNYLIGVTILKKLSATTMTTVKVHCMAGQQPAHNSGNRASIRSQQKVKMVGNQDPGKTFCAGFREYLSKPIQKIDPVGIIFKYISALNPSYNNMMKGSWSINAGFTWHAKTKSYIT